MRKVVKETQERVRLFEENQRRWQQEQQQQRLRSPPMAPQVRRAAVFSLGCTVVFLNSISDNHNREVASGVDHK